MDSIRTFEDLGCWKEAQILRKSLRTLCQKISKNEEYLLKSQIVRASRSVTNNIAEGFGRFHYRENIQFCRISRGSLFELIDHLIIAKEENYCNEHEFEELRKQVELVIKILNGYIQYLSKASNNVTQ